MRKETSSAVRLLYGLVTALALTFSGCGAQGEVSGTVRFNGRPLPGGRVTFINQTQRGAAALARIGEDGTYKVIGCPAGPVKITVQTVIPRTPSALPQPKPAPGRRPAVIIIPARYADPATSGLDYDVAPGEQQHDIDLRP